MKITVSSALIALRTVEELLNVKMPFGAAFALKRMGKELAEVNSALEEEKKNLIMEYAVIGDNGEPVVDGNQYKIRPEVTEEFNSAYRDMLLEEVDIKSTLTSKGMEGVEVTPSMLFGLGDLLVE